MTLLTHAVVGAAAGRLTKNPLGAFLVGFASHFLLDAIPHWDYKPASRFRHPNDFLKDDLVLGKKFLYDLSRIGLDCLLGFAIALYTFEGKSGFMHFSLSFSGAAGAVLPDALQFLYWKIRKEPLTSLQKFHTRIQDGPNLHDRPVLGPFIQAVIVVLSILLSKFIL